MNYNYAILQSLGDVSWVRAFKWCIYLTYESKLRRSYIL